jgi:hypothetical protein
MLLLLFMHEAAQPQLLEIVLALRLSGRFAGALHCRHQHRNQNADDGDYDEQLDERKAASRREAIFVHR